MPALAIEVFLTILKTTSIDEIDSMDHSDSLVQFAQMIFSVDDLTDAAIELLLAMIKNCLYFVLQLETLLIGFGAVPIGLLAGFLYDLAISDKPAGQAVDDLWEGLARWRQWTYDDMERRYHDHNAELDAHMGAILHELQEFGHRWKLLFRGALLSMAREAGLVAPAAAR